MATLRWHILLYVAVLAVTEAFLPGSPTWTPSFSRITPSALTPLSATGKKGSSKRRRRRKKPPAAPAQDPVKVSQPTIVEGLEQEDEEGLTKADDDDLAVISDVAKFEFQTDKELTMGVVQDKEIVEETSTSSAVEPSSNAIPLPDIKEARKKKQMEQELARLEKEQEEQRVKIKRSDKEAFTKVRGLNSCKFCDTL